MPGTTIRPDDDVNNYTNQPHISTGYGPTTTEIRPKSMRDEGSRLVKKEAEELASLV